MRVDAWLRQCGRRLHLRSHCDPGARVFVAVCDPICAVQARVENVQAAAIEGVVSEMDIFVSVLCL